MFFMKFENTKIFDKSDVDVSYNKHLFTLAQAYLREILLRCPYKTGRLYNSINMSYTGRFIITSEGAWYIRLLRRKNDFVEQAATAVDIDQLH